MRLFRKLTQLVEYLSPKQNVEGSSPLFPVTVCRPEVGRSPWETEIEGSIPSTLIMREWCNGSHGNFRGSCRDACGFMVS